MFEIAFAGASGTGKSFFAKRVAAALNLPLQPSFARAVAADMGFASPYDVDAAGKRDAYQMQVLARMITWQSDHRASGYVADRSVFDVLTYTQIHCSQRAVVECRDALLLTKKRYHALVLCPMASWFDTGTDPARRHDRIYHLEFEQMLRQFTEIFEHPLVLSLTRTSDLGREAWCDQFIQKLRGGK